MQNILGIRLGELSQIAVIAPAIHLFISFVFITGYSLGFGGGVGTLFSITDIFSITLTDIYYVYIFGFIIPLLSIIDKLIVDRHKENNTNKDSLNFFNIFELSGKTVRVTLLLIMIISILFVLFYFYIANYFKALMPYNLIQAALIISLPYILMIDGENSSIRLKRRTIALLIVGLILSSLASGLSQGQLERRYSISHFENRVFCSDFKILRSTSQGLIAVSKNGDRIIIDSKCQTIFKFPHRTIANEPDFFDLAKRFIKS